jgi:hypothetical protein
MLSERRAVERVDWRSETLDCSNSNSPAWAAIKLAVEANLQSTTATSGRASPDPNPVGGSSGETLVEIAKLFGVSHMTIARL